MNSSSLGPLGGDQALNRDNPNLFQRQSNRDFPEMDSSEPVFNFDIINETRTKESARVHVPITLCLIILTSYVCGGGALFSIWEGWNFLDGAYFCFVTLSKIFLLFLMFYIKSD